MTLRNRRILGVVLGLVIALLLCLGIRSVYVYGCLRFRPGYVQLCVLLFPTAVHRLGLGRPWLMFMEYAVPLLAGGLVALFTYGRPPHTLSAFGGKQPMPPREFMTGDNKGIRYQDHGHARSDWIATHLTNHAPGVIYHFPSLPEAECAIRQLSYIHAASDTGELISDEVIDFGCYINEEGQGEVIICGKLLTLSLCHEAKEKLSAAGGTLSREQAPQEPTPSP